MQIVVTFDPACGVDQRKAALWCAAFDAQAREFCAKWGLDPVAVNFYSSDVLAKLTDDEITKFAADSYLVTVQMSLDVPNALGFHDDVAGVIFARVMWQGDATTITLSHEILELLGDKTCDQYADLGNGTKQAVEACDRCEGDSYVETGTIGDDSMPVSVSDYLYQSAFVPNSAPPWDRMNRLTAWNETRPEGYMIVLAADGSTSDVFAETDWARETVALKRKNPGSRLSRRLAK